MEKNTCEMIGSRERGSAAGNVLVALALAANCFNLGLYIGKDIAHVGEHEKDIQLRNEQVNSQLTSQDRPVTGLVLEDDGSFTFKSTTDEGQPETCDGNYSVKDNVAKVTGQISCTSVQNFTSN